MGSTKIFFWKSSAPFWRRWPFFMVNRLHSRELTWNLKMMVSNRKLLFRVSIFGCHVSFRGCNHHLAQLLFLRGGSSRRFIGQRRWCRFHTHVTRDLSGKAWGWFLVEVLVIFFSGAGRFFHSTDMRNVKQQRYGVLCIGRDFHGSFGLKLDES